MNQPFAGAQERTVVATRSQILSTTGCRTTRNTVVRVALTSSQLKLPRHTCAECERTRKYTPRGLTRGHHVPRVFHPSLIPSQFHLSLRYIHPFSISLFPLASVSPSILLSLPSASLSRLHSTRQQGGQRENSKKSNDSELCRRTEKHGKCEYHLDPLRPAGLIPYRVMHLRTKA